MTSTPLTEEAVAARRSGPLRELDHPAQVFAWLGPNWFASVMGTGIVANAAATLPVWLPGTRVAATVVWALGALLLLALTAAWVVHWLRHPATARGHARDPVMAQFWGAPPMALMTVGAGALLLGRDWIGLGPALTADWVLWTAGTVLGLVTTAWIPYLMMTTHDIARDAAFGGWLMPVVPPMVSAANGALLVEHLPPGQPRLTMLLGCYAMFGISLFATLFVVPQLWQRLVHHKTGAAEGVPTVWIVLGPLGQSVTAANLLARPAGEVLPAPYGGAAEALGLFYGVSAWGFAVVWLVLAAALTLRTVRVGMPFALTWWSFTFPVGTVVTGTSALAARTGAALFVVVAVVLYLLLVLAWLTVAVRTARAGYRGGLFRPVRWAPSSRSGAVA
ncbi:C4-dicarboxylate ABC transporter [Actinopolyspora erythraea]|uniref:C4-dicarboxylate ABC transporter n=1 Tax=Actinopolyspora erythraea TaxID=414996 RepID=A0A099D9A7_9ACTN|nr:TDT family transporter [Actinopolyspora erythraea]ASU80569.1 C4-dicarboxylate ABC transporter [Actinopolyspora erythraea]KGI82753.1 C4-dicarboxylate ABC transporter [Actinopolyspora erythraea]